MSRQRAGSGSASTSPSWCGSCRSSWLTLPAGDRTVAPWISKPGRSAHAGCMIKAPHLPPPGSVRHQPARKALGCASTGHPASTQKVLGAASHQGQALGWSMLQGILKFLEWSRPGRRCWVEKGCWWRSYGSTGKWVKQRHPGCPKGRLRVALVEDCHGRIHGCCFQSSHTTREEVEGMLLLKAGEPIRGAREAVSQG